LPPHDCPVPESCPHASARTLPHLAPCCSLLKEKEQELHVLAAALLQNETLTLAEIQALVASVSSPELPGGSLGQLDEAAGGSVGGSGAVAVPAPAPAAAAAAAAASVAIGLSK
jgi:hypothetical protein